MCFLVYQGDAALASSNQLIGQFQLGPLPRADAGALKIKVRPLKDPLPHYVACVSRLR
jgi:molecular chaperone DnaK (HSP70)